MTSSRAGRDADTAAARVCTRADQHEWTPLVQLLDHRAAKSTSRLAITDCSRADLRAEFCNMVHERRPHWLTMSLRATHDEGRSYHVDEACDGCMRLVVKVSQLMAVTQAKRQTKSTKTERGAGTEVGTPRTLVELAERRISMASCTCLHWLPHVCELASIRVHATTHAAD